MLELILGIASFIITVVVLFFTTQGREIVENVRYHVSRLTRIVSVRLRPPAPDDSLDPGDWSIFVGDTTIPDGTKVLVNSRFTKTWEIRNVGSVTWDDR